MEGFLRVLFDSIAYLWPFRIIKTWQRGGLYEYGKFIRVLGPGCWPIIPFFTDVLEISVVPAIVRTPRLDITLSDGSSLTFAAAAWAKVASYDLAINTVDDFKETTQELMAAVLAEQLAEIDGARVQPSRRKGLIKTLTVEINKESSLFGIEVTGLRFTTFVTSVRTYRLLQDQANSETW